MAVGAHAQLAPGQFADRQFGVRQWGERQFGAHGEAEPPADDDSQVIKRRNLLLGMIMVWTPGHTLALAVLMFTVAATVAAARVRHITDRGARFGRRDE